MKNTQANINRHNIMSKSKRNASYVPGFLDGLASIFGSPVPIESEKNSDRDAMSSDWEQVGNDIRMAMDKILIR